MPTAKVTKNVSAATGGSTVFGAVNAAGVTGNVYLEFSAENASSSSGAAFSFVRILALQKGVNANDLIEEGMKLII